MTTSTASQPSQNIARFGVPGLDNILGGGLPAKHVYLLEGNPGSGKTTLALHFLLEGVRQGESVLYVTLSETRVELQDVARSHGWSMDQIQIHELSVAQDETLPNGQYTFFHPSEVELGQTTKNLLEEVDRVRPTRVIFDSLSEMRLLAQDPLRYRRQILGLKQFFSGKNCTVLLIDDLTSGAADLQPQSLAHGVVSLEQISTPYGVDRRRLRIGKMRGVKFRSGFHDFVLDTGGITVFPRLVAADYRPPFKKESLQTGLAEFDLLLGGGLDRGSSNLFIGPAGIGKTSLSTQFACAMASRGERTAIFIFDEVLETFIDRSESLNMPISKFIKEGLVLLHQIDPAEISPGEFAHRVRKAVQEDQCRCVVLDSLDGYTLSMPNEHYLVAQLHELISFLNQVGVVSILIAAQHGISSPMRADAGLNISYLADTAIHLRFFESAGRVRRAISVLKKRSGPHENTIRELVFRKGGIELGQALTQFQGILSGSPTYIGAVEELLKPEKGT